MMEFDSLLTLESSTDAVTAAGIHAVWLSRHLIAPRLLRSVGHEFNKRLASFESDLAWK